MRIIGIGALMVFAAIIVLLSAYDIYSLGLEKAAGRGGIGLVCSGYMLYVLWNRLQVELGYYEREGY